MQSLQRELEIHRNLERELMEAKQAAESAVMAKGEFLATMSHEIRTPLNGIMPMLDLLMTSKLPPDQHEFLRTAYTSSQQLLRIVDDILDYSKLEANKLKLETDQLQPARTARLGHPADGTAGRGQGPAPAPATRPGGAPGGARRSRCGCARC